MLGQKLYLGVTTEGGEVCCVKIVLPAAVSLFNPLPALLDEGALPHVPLQSQPRCAENNAQTQTHQFQAKGFGCQAFIILLELKYIA